MVGANIRQQRIERGLTQAALSKRALVTQANLSAIETGRRDLTVGTLLRFANALGVRPASLLDPVTVRRTTLGRHAADAVARSVLTGIRKMGPDLNQLASGLAWLSRPGLAAVGAPGVRRASRRAWTECESRWSAALLRLLEARVRKHLASSAGGPDLS